MYLFIKERKIICTDNDKHMQVYSITRRFLFTVKQTEKHLRALTVSHLHVNWL